MLQGNRTGSSSTAIRFKTSCRSAEGGGLAIALPFAQLPKAVINNNRDLLVRSMTPLYFLQSYFTPSLWYLHWQAPGPGLRKGWVWSSSGWWINFFLTSLCFALQVRPDLRGHREGAASDRHLQDADPRGMPALPRQRGVQARQVPSLRRAVHQPSAPHLGCGQHTLHQVNSKSRLTLLTF